MRQIPFASAAGYHPAVTRIAHPPWPSISGGALDAHPTISPVKLTLVDIQGHPVGIAEVCVSTARRRLQVNGVCDDGSESAEGEPE